MPDRFLDGDPTNNYGGDKGQGSTREEVLRHGYLPTHKGYYHGGDLRGVMMALPYLQGMIDIYRHWIEVYGVDGFRIGTTRHVNIEFWHAFAPAMQQAAKDKGIEHFIAFGEVADGRPEVLSYFTTQAQLRSVLDFGFQKAARAFASRSGSADQFRPLF